MDEIDLSSLGAYNNTLFWVVIVGLRLDHITIQAINQTIRRLVPVQ